MNVRAIALTAGIFGAVTMFILPWWLILTGNADGPVTLLERIYIGYSFTPMGSVIGAAWGFFDWAIAGAIFVGLLIASVKGYLVAANFMHLNSEKQMIYWILILTVFFLILLLFIPLLWDLNNMANH